MTNKYIYPFYETNIQILLEHKLPCCITTKENTRIGITDIPAESLLTVKPNGKKLKLHLYNLSDRDSLRQPDFTATESKIGDQYLHYQKTIRCSLQDLPETMLLHNGLTQIYLADIPVLHARKTTIITCLLSTVTFVNIFPETVTHNAILCVGMILLIISITAAAGKIAYLQKKQQLLTAYKNYRASLQVDKKPDI